MGQPQHNQQSGGVARARQRPRTCLRKGCGRVYCPTRWNQRYCRDPECRRLVRRWQAAKRQRARRRLPENRKRHAEAEAKRRRDRAAQPRTHDPVAVEKTASQDRAWSRSKQIPGEFCDRPGCYEPLPNGSRAPVRYCGRDCRQALRAVRDRERKWLSRNRYRARDDLSQQTFPASDTQQSVTTGKIIDQDTEPVGDYGNTRYETLSCQTTTHDSPPCSQQGSHQNADSKTHPRPRSRPPPSE